MFAIFSNNNKRLEKVKKPSSSEFSDFFRKASSGEKKRVFIDVAKKASERQRAYMQ